VFYRYTSCRDRIPIFLESYTEKILSTGKYLNVVSLCGESVTSQGREASLNAGTVRQASAAPPGWQNMQGSALDERLTSLRLEPYSLSIYSGLFLPDRSCFSQHIDFMVGYCPVFAFLTRFYATALNGKRTRV